MDRLTAMSKAIDATPINRKVDPQVAAGHRRRVAIILTRCRAQIDMDSVDRRTEEGKAEMGRLAVEHHGKLAAAKAEWLEACATLGLLPPPERTGPPGVCRREGCGRKLSLTAISTHTKKTKATRMGYCSQRCLDGPLKTVPDAPTSRPGEPMPDDLRWLYGHGGRVRHPVHRATWAALCGYAPGESSWRGMEKVDWARLVILPVCVQCARGRPEIRAWEVQPAAGQVTE